jgi:transcriptional regulator of acetoin/glycerol metabolism
VLRSVQGNKAAAARLLGMDRKTLYRKLEAYGRREF